jgi:predicted flap endonuclease-1-like 5' DNA nuclease
MLHYVLEIILWMLPVFFVGCVIGWLARRMFGSAPKLDAVAEEPVAPTVEAAPGMAPMSVAANSGKAERPKGIAAPRNGKADNLQKITGIGPKNEKVLHNLGFFHFDQIAAWTDDQVDWVDSHLKFNGRIRREEWTTQCEILASGDEAGFRKAYGTAAAKK